MVGTAGAAVAEPGREDTAKEKGPPAPRQPGGEPGFEPADGVAMGGFWAGGVTCSGVSEPPGCSTHRENPRRPCISAARRRRRLQGGSVRTLGGRVKVPTGDSNVEAEHRMTVVPGFGARRIGGGCGCAADHFLRWRSLKKQVWKPRDLELGFRHPAVGSPIRVTKCAGDWV